MRGSRQQGPFAGLHEPLIVTENLHLAVTGTVVNCYQEDEAHAAVERILVPWFGDTDNLMDRYDARLLLDDLTVYEQSSRGYSRAAVDADEAAAEQERYLDYHPSREHLLSSPFTVLDAQPGLQDSVQDHSTDDNPDSPASGGHPHQGPAFAFNYGTSHMQSEAAGPAIHQQQQQQQTPLTPLHASCKQLQQVYQPPFADIPEQLTGHLPDSGRVHQIIAQTAKFVRENGSRVEVLLRVKHGANPNFAFLIPQDRLFPYYRWLVKEAPSERVRQTPQEEQDSQQEQGGQQPTASAAAAAPGVPSSPQGLAALGLLRAYSMASEADSEQAEADQQLGATAAAGNAGASCARGQGDGDIGLPVYGPAALAVTSCSQAPGKAETAEGETAAAGNGSQADGAADIEAAVPAAGRLEHGTSAFDAATDGAAGVAAAEPAPPGEEMHSGLDEVPTPQIKAIIDKLVAFVAKKGIKFESVVRTRECSNQRFAFLHMWSPHHVYYRHKLKLALGPDEAAQLFKSWTTGAAAAGSATPATPEPAATAATAAAAGPAVAAPGADSGVQQPSAMAASAWASNSTRQWAAPVKPLILKANPRLVLAQRAAAAAKLEALAETAVDQAEGQPSAATATDPDVAAAGSSLQGAGTAQQGRAPANPAVKSAMAQTAYHGSRTPTPEPVSPPDGVAAAASPGDGKDVASSDAPGSETAQAAATDNNAVAAAAAEQPAATSAIAQLDANQQQQQDQAGQSVTAKVPVAAGEAGSLPADPAADKATKRLRLQMYLRQRRAELLAEQQQQEQEQKARAILRHRQLLRLLATRADADDAGSSGAGEEGKPAAAEERQQQSETEEGEIADEEAAAAEGAAKRAEVFRLLQGQNKQVQQEKQPVLTVLPGLKKLAGSAAAAAALHRAALLAGSDGEVEENDNGGVGVVNRGLPQQGLDQGIRQSTAGNASASSMAATMADAANAAAAALAAGRAPAAPTNAQASSVVAAAIAAAAAAAANAAAANKQSGTSSRGAAKQRPDAAADTGSSSDRSAILSTSDSADSTSSNSGSSRSRKTRRSTPSNRSKNRKSSRKRSRHRDRSTDDMVHSKRGKTSRYKRSKRSRSRSPSSSPNKLRSNPDRGKTSHQHSPRHSSKNRKQSRRCSRSRSRSRSPSQRRSRHSKHTDSDRHKRSKRYDVTTRERQPLQRDPGNPTFPAFQQQQQRYASSRDLQQTGNEAAAIVTQKREVTPAAAPAASAAEAGPIPPSVDSDKLRQRLRQMIGKLK